MRSEFQFINHIKKHFSASHIGDDCAVLPKDQISDLLITADLLIEDVDFRLKWAKPSDIGHKSLAVSLSDIAAMGGTPTFALVSLGIPEDLWNGDFLDNFYSGWRGLADSFNVELVGGDVSSSERLVIDSIVLGDVPKGKAVMRSGAMPGDLIFVSGSLGGAAAGLRLLERSDRSQKWGDQGSELVSKQLRPNPRVELGQQLRALGMVTSMIDISDGLSSDLWHICEASEVGATIEARSLPVDPNLTSEHQRDVDILNLMLNGGEDFELLFTIASDSADLLTDLPVTRIGAINESKLVEIKMEGMDGLTRPIEPRGFRHF